MSMMCLGQFVFELATTPYQSAQQHLGWRHPANSRVGLRPARQFLGRDEESITLAGVLLPEVSGGEPSLDALRGMADEGAGYVLIDGTGKLFGVFVIESIELTRSVFTADGTARRIEFSMSLKRTDDDAVKSTGNLPGGGALAL